MLKKVAVASLDFFLQFRLNELKKSFKEWYLNMWLYIRGNHNIDYLKSFYVHVPTYLLISKSVRNDGCKCKKGYLSYE